MNLISRESAKAEINKLMEIHFDRTVVLGKAKDKIESLPSAFEGMTNGEVMKAIFPDIEVTINEFLGSVVIDGAFGKFITTLDWWLDSYKGVSE